MLPTRFPFHLMLGLSIAVAVTGIALGAEARRGPEDGLDGSSHTAAVHRGERARVAVEQSVAPPLPIAPRFGAEVPGRPVLAWRLEEGTDGARVELSPTSDFDESGIRRIDVRGQQVTLPPTWPAGVWYWRLRGRDGAIVGDRATPTWMLFVTESAGAS
ncbi:MAG TPA: hypothetical protein VGL81_12175 [Polyangiaceae bacterium]|jgi:hypothetical protein